MEAISLKKTLNIVKQNSASLWRQTANLLWPSVCKNCFEPIEDNRDNFCHICWFELQKATASSYCKSCGKDVSEYAIINDHCPACSNQQINYDAIARAGRYRDALKSILLKFKFNDTTQFRNDLGFLANAALQGSDFKDDIDYFVPVPLHWKRRIKRGFNQSLLITRKLDIPKQKINTDLVRHRDTKPQIELTTPAARKKNVENAFAVRRDHKFKNKNICLVDDIKTTNATLNECSKTLKLAGAHKVYALVIAVADQPDKY